MSPPGRSTSDTELEVLKALWALTAGTVREIQERLRDEGRSWAYTTVQTLLARLEQKGFVSSDRNGRAHVFRPAVSRTEFLGEHLGDLADRVCEGASVPLLLSLVQAGRFTTEEIEQFRALLDELEADPGRGSNPPRR
jgi:predicted transcriptional regulator